MKNITTTEFKELIGELSKTTEFKFKGNKFTIVKCGTSWCNPCVQLEKILNNLSEDFPEIDIFNVDVEAEIDIAKYFNIRSVPTTLYISPENKIEIVTGLSQESEIKSIIESFTTK